MTYICMVTLYVLSLKLIVLLIGSASEVITVVYESVIANNIPSATVKGVIAVTGAITIGIGIYVGPDIYEDHFGQS